MQLDQGGTGTMQEFFQRKSQSNNGILFFERKTIALLQDNKESQDKCVFVVKA